MRNEIRRSRLAELIRSRYKGERAGLIAESGLSKGRVAQLLDSEFPFGERAARELERRLGLPSLYFDEVTSDNIEEGPPIRGAVPLISWVQAGQWEEAVDTFQPGEAELWIPVVRQVSPRGFALRVRGDSMTSPHGRSYPEGSFIVVEPERRSPVNGDRVVARLEGSSEVTFKVYKEEDGRRWLQPLNPMHRPIFEPFRVLGTVIAMYLED